VGRGSKPAESGPTDRNLSAISPGRGVSDEQLFKLFVDAVIDYAIYTLDPHGRVMTWNAGAEKIKGYRREEIHGQHFSRFFTLEDQAAGLPGKALETAKTSGHFVREGWRVRKNGSRFWASTVLQAVRGPAGELIGFAKITRDITERMEAQTALLESESRFRILVDGLIDYAIYMLDPSGIITNWNAGAQRMKGYSAREIVGEHFSKFYTARDRTAGLPAQVLATAIKEGRYEAEGWRVRKDGSHFWASVVVDTIRGDHGDLIGFAKITRDITERQKAQDALRESERQFRLLVAGVTDYALYMLDPNGLITSWNGGAQRIKGYTSDEIIGQHFSRFYTEPDRAAGLPARSLHTAETTGRFESENWRVRKDGTLFWANVVIDAIRDENGRLVGFAKITRDMTDKRNAQIALDQAQAKRAQSQKFEALGQLTGCVAHISIIY
jgi:PAS domain S-box-containing protein